MTNDLPELTGEQLDAARELHALLEQLSADALGAARKETHDYLNDVVARAAVGEIDPRQQVLMNAMYMLCSTGYMALWLSKTTDAPFDREAFAEAQKTIFVELTVLAIGWEGSIAVTALHEQMQRAGAQIEEAFKEAMA